MPAFDLDQIPSSQSAPKPAHYPIATKILIIVVLGVVLFVSGYYFYMDGITLAGLHEDDVQYYSVISNHLLHGRLFTFDGLNRTNGFHPLWAVMLAPLHLVLKSPEAFVRGVFALSYLLWLASIAILFLIVRDATAGLARTGNLFVATGIALYFGLEKHFYKVIVTGLETPVFVALCLLFTWLGVGGRLIRWVRERPFLMGVSLGTIFLARLDAGFFVVIALAILPFMGLLKEKSYQKAAFFTFGIALLPLSYLALSVAMTGAMAPVSGLLKRALAPQLCELSVPGVTRTLSHLSLYINSPFWAVEVWPIFSSMFEGLTANIKAVPLWYGVTPALAWFSTLVILLTFGLYAVVRYAHRAADGPSMVFLDFLALASFAGLAFNKMIYSCGLVPYYYSALFDVSQVLLWGYVLGRWRRLPVRTGMIMFLAWVLLLSIPLQVRTHRAFYRQALKLPVNDWIQVGRWVHDNLPPDAKIGAFNAGNISHFSQRTVVNLDGKVNSKAFFERVRSQRSNGEASRQLMGFMQEEHIDYIADSVPCDAWRFPAQVSEATHGSVRLELVHEVSRQHDYCGRIFRIRYGGT